MNIDFINDNFHSIMGCIFLAIGFMALVLFRIIAQGNRDRKVLKDNIREFNERTAQRYADNHLNIK